MTRASLNFNLLVKFLGSTVLLCAAGGLALAAFDKPVPDFIIQLGSSALAGMAAAFIRPPETGVVPVSIDGQDEPVEVTETKRTRKKTTNSAYKKG